MTHREFIGKMSIYYKEQMMDGTLPNIRIEENLNWIRRNVPEGHLADLWAGVIMQFKPTMTVPYPLIGDLQEVYDSMPLKEGPSSFRQSSLDRGETMPSGRIAALVNSLRAREAPSMAEIDFIETWEVLAYHWGRIIDETGDEYRALQYCDEVKRRTLRGDTEKFDEVKDTRVVETVKTIFDGKVV